ncbi:lmbrd2, partial [Symbiodinium pilosum]
VFVALIVACVLSRFADKDASWLSLMTSVAGVTIAISVVAVMPYDVWQAVAGGAGNPDSLLQSTWAVTYWTTALLSYLLCPILMEFEASGDFTIAARLRTSMRRNAVFYIAYTLILGILLAILIVRGEVQGDVQSWCIAASNAWGLFVLTVLMGFGLVAVPRHFWSLADPSALLQDLYV